MLQYKKNAWLLKRVWYYGSRLSRNKKLKASKNKTFPVVAFYNIWAKEQND